MSYNKNIWKRKDRITKEKLNHMEDGIHDAHDKIKGAINDLSSQIKDIAVNITSKGAVSKDISTDNSIIINKSFNYGDTVFVPDGVFYCKTGITIPYNKRLLLSPNAELVLLNSDIDFIKFRNSSKLEGGTIRVNTQNYSHSALFLDGDARIDNGYIKDTVVISDDNSIPLLSGNGIKITAEKNGECVSFFSIINVKVQYFNIGLLLTTNINNNGFVNGNLFNDIKIVGSKFGIKFGETDNVNCATNGNKFNNIQFQDINSSTESCIIFNGGSQNVLTNVHFWDVPLGKKAMIMRENAYFNYIEHNLYYNHDTVIEGYWEQNKNTQTINGYKTDLFPHDIGGKNIGLRSTPWANAWINNINALSSIKSYGILEQESVADSDGYTWKARLGASKWGYIILQIIKSKDGTDTVIRELRLLNDGTFYPQSGTVNLGSISNPFNMLYSNYLSLKASDGSRWTINVSPTGDISTTKIDS